jgi:hypothetical protein
MVMNTVVYYPHVLPSSKWLKLAAICWDKVYCLIPDSGFPSSTETIELAQSLGGIIQSVDIMSIANRPDVQNQFKAWVEAHRSQLMHHSEQLDGKSCTDWDDQLGNLPVTNSIGYVNSWVSLSEAETASPLPDWRREYMALLPGKGFDEQDAAATSPSERPSFLTYLNSLGLVRHQTRAGRVYCPIWLKEYYEEYGGFANAPPTPEPIDGSEEAVVLAKYREYHDLIYDKYLNGDYDGAVKLKERYFNIYGKFFTTADIRAQDDVAYVPQEIAHYYLALCASKAAEDGKRDLAGDTDKFKDVIFHEHQLRGHVATSVMEMYVPEGFYAMNPLRIAEIREEYAQQRIKYQKDVDAVCREFAEVASEGELGNVKARIVDIAKERIDAVRKINKHFKYESVIKALSLSITPPALAASIASWLGVGLFLPAGILASLSLFTAKILIDRDRKDDTVKNAPWSYIIDVAKFSD